MSQRGGVFQEPGKLSKYSLIATNQFKRDSKKARKQGKDFQKVQAVVKQLANGEVLVAKYRDHDLTGNWKGYRECHLSGDWLLIYQICGDKLILHRLGSHSELLD